ncbi:LysR family transcriptional regulator [Rheinheimera muenzenbergensis]|uniref:LysR family transcriptional regulator n=1 Tax=Rheinheimera muenzenbergensis TaxID=1193628 RepID=A0ABU8C1I3_9GAMM
MDKITAMRVFSQVANNGSFSKTAEQLEMSRAMVTRCISVLEDWLNTRLFQRTTRKVTLTAAGEQFLLRCQQILTLTDEVEAESATLNSELRGQLRLTCSASFGYARMAGAIADFLALHPKLKIDMNVGDTIVNLIEARVDLAIRISNNPDPMLIARRLGSCASVLVASPAYLAQFGQPLSPEALVKHQCLSHSIAGRQLWQFQRDGETIKVEIDACFTANDATVLLCAALAGGGMTLQPSYLVQDYLAAGQLVALLPEWSLPELEINALYSSRRHMPVALRAFLDFLVERFASKHMVKSR